MPLASPLPPPSLTHALADRLREQLRTGSWSPGEAIDEHTLAHRWGVGRCALRDAAALLVHEGSLVRHPEQGLCVVRHDEAAQQEALALQQLLATFVAAPPPGASTGLAQALLQQVALRLPRTTP